MQNSHPTVTTTQTPTADAPIIINARLEGIMQGYRRLHMKAHGRQLSAETCAELDALQTDLNAMYLRLRTLERQAAAPEPVGAYNGYPNGETYSVIRCLDSNAAHIETAAAIVAAAWWNASDEVAADSAAIVAPRADAADALRAWLEEEENPLADTATLFTDLLAHALARVDWGEVADHYAPNPLPSLEPFAGTEEEEAEEEACPHQWVIIRPANPGPDGWAKRCKLCGFYWDISAEARQEAAERWQSEEEAEEEEAEADWRQSLASERERED
jgi:hypothetical protein